VKVEKRFNMTWFPWLLENEWTLLAYVKDEQAAQQLMIDQYKITHAYEYRIVE
jgi:hypothetical protein